MKIYRGDVGIEMALEDFLDILEDEFADDVFELILGLGEMDEVMSMMDASYGFYGAEGEYDKADLQEYIEDLESEGYDIEVIAMDADDFKKAFGVDIEDITGGGKIIDTKKSAEDMHVERIVRKYAHIDDASY